MSIQLLVIAKEGSADWEKVCAYMNRRLSTQLVYTTSEAYQILRKEPIGIVLAEYDLPKVNGIKLLKKIKAIKPSIEVIFLSKNITLTKAIEAMKEGAYDIYEFPINPKLIMTVIGKAIEKQSLYLEKEELQRKVKQKFDPGKIIGRSKTLNRVIEVVSSVAPKNVNILIKGETGTGKELVASAIHYNSPRAGKSFVKVNCGAFSEGVLESELFGHEKGAFTGAITARVGRFEMADGGTLFLDEIGDISLSTQIKLLRVLQEREFERVGGNKTLKVDVRLIAATNKDLSKLIVEGKFREDLFYRLNVVHIEIPPLRERKDDIPLLVTTFINKLNEEKGYKIKGISKEAMRILMNYRWPGNVRELENAIESAMALTDKEIIQSTYLPAFLLMPSSQEVDFYQIPKNLTLPEMEIEIIKLTLERTGGNKSKAAKQLGIGLRTLQRKV